MTHFTSNLRTALICNRREDYVEDVPLFLFQAAFCFAKKGFSTCIFTTPLDKKYEVSDQHLLHPEILQRVQLRYLKSFQDVIKWCHKVHQLHKKPLVVLIPLDEFSDTQDVKKIRICAALIDVLLYCSRIDKSKEFYLLATTSIIFSCSDYVSQVHSFFHFSWLYTKENSYILLQPLNDEEKVLLPITIHDTLDFRHIIRIFSGFHSKTALV